MTTIQAGTDPQRPIPLSCSISSAGDLEVKYGSDLLTEPDTILHVDLDDHDWSQLQTADFGNYEVDATTVQGSDWSDAGSTVTSEVLYGGSDPGRVHEIQVTASDGGTPKAATIRVRIREQNANPLPRP